MKTAKMSYYIAIAILLMYSTGIIYAKERTRDFGDCLEGKDSCSECYLALKKSLLSRDDNIQNLSAAFYPSNANLPIFVTVTYNFNTSDHSAVWYWTTDSAYLFFEITTFQYLSLFFSKPAALFSQSVTLTLDEDCFGASEDMFKLLTQRLKNLIEKMGFNPDIDENYFARTERNTENLFTSSISIYTLVFYIVGFIMTSTMAVLRLWIYYQTEQMDIELYKSSWSKIFSIALTVGILMLYILALDIAAVVTIKDKTPVLNERNIDDNAFPYILLSLDGTIVVLWCVCWILTFVTWSKKCRRCRCCNGKQYLLQAILTVGPILVLVTHLPYVAISYLNDASYASSIFIYYTVVSFVVFGSVESTFRMCQRTIFTGERSGESRTGNGSTYNQRLVCSSFQWGLKIVVLVLFVPFVVLLIGMTTAALVVVPISRAFSDAPNRLAGFYETLIVVVGAYFAYISFFNKKPTLEAAVKKRKQHILQRKEDTDWKQLSDDGKVEEFYDYVVDLVVLQQNGLGRGKHDGGPECDEDQQTLGCEEPLIVNS